MKTLRQLFFKLFKCYRRTELKFCTYAEGDQLIKQNEGKPEDQQWRLAKEEDSNRTIGWVYIEKRRRITE